MSAVLTDLCDCFYLNKFYKFIITNSLKQTAKIGLYYFCCFKQQRDKNSWFKNFLKKNLKYEKTETVLLILAILSLVFKCGIYPIKCRKFYTHLSKTVFPYPQ